MLTSLRNADLKNYSWRVTTTTVAGTAVGTALFEDPLRPTIATKFTDEAGMSVGVAPGDRDAQLRPTRTQLVVPDPVNGNRHCIQRASYAANGDVTLWWVNPDLGNDPEGAPGVGTVKPTITDHAGRPVRSVDEEGIGSKVTYSASGFVTSSTDDRDATTNYVYDPLTGFLKAVLHPIDEATQTRSGVVYIYDANGNVLSETHTRKVTADGKVDESEYYLPEPLADKRPRTYRYEYNDLDLCSRAIDPSGIATTYLYYPNGKLDTTTYPGGRTEKRIYDTKGRLERITQNPGNFVTKYQYHANGQVRQIDHPDGRVTEVAFDSRGRVSTKSVTGQGTLTYTYVSPTVTHITDSNNHTTIQVTDASGRVVKETRPGDRTTTFTYDFAGHLVGMKDPKGRRFRFENHRNGRRQNMYLVSALGETLLGSYVYDGNTPVSDGDVSWTLDGRGRPLTVSGPNAVVDYTYDHPLGLPTT